MAQRDPYPTVVTMDLVTWTDPITGQQRQGSSTERAWWQRNPYGAPGVPGSAGYRPPQTPRPQFERRDLVTWTDPVTGQQKQGSSTQRDWEYSNAGVSQQLPPRGFPMVTNRPGRIQPLPGQERVVDGLTLSDLRLPTQPIERPMVQPVQPPQAQQPTVPTLQAPPAVSGVYNPSALAAQESGAIGAASIASQMPKPKTSAFAQAAKPKPYSVQRGDTLSAIAAKNKMSLKQLMKLNPQFTQNAKYQGGNRIFSGTKVNLAPKAPKAPTTPASFNPGSFRLAENKGM